MKEEIKEVKMESEEEAQKNRDWDDRHSYFTQAMRRVIHRNKPFLRKGGVLMIKVDWDILFNCFFFMGYRFKLEQKLSSKKPTKIRVKFHPEDCI